MEFADGRTHTSREGYIARRYWGLEVSHAGTPVARWSGVGGRTHHRVGIIGLGAGDSLDYTFHGVGVGVMVLRVAWWKLLKRHGL